MKYTAQNLRTIQRANMRPTAGLLLRGDRTTRVTMARPIRLANTIGGESLSLQDAISLTADLVTAIRLLTQEDDA